MPPIVDKSGCALRNSPVGTVPLDWEAYAEPGEDIAQIRMLKIIDVMRRYVR